MAYKTADLEKKALEAIEKHKLFFIEDVVSFLPCGKVTFYEHKLNEANSIKEALEKNKVEIKVSMRSKWYKSDAPALQIALYKIIGTEEESDRINSQKVKAVVSTEITESIEKAFEGLDDEKV
jgi:hypothetical protein